VNVEAEPPVSQQEEEDFINENLLYLSTFLDKLKARHNNLSSESEVLLSEVKNKLSMFGHSLPVCTVLMPVSLDSSAIFKPRFAKDVIVQHEPLNISTERSQQGLQ